MATVYVREQGAVVRKRGERIVVTKNGSELEDVPLIHVDQLVVLGNVQVTTPAAAALMSAGVDVAFFTINWSFRFRLAGTGPSRLARLRFTQYQKMSQEDFCLAVAREVVVGKLTNQRTILERQAATITDRARERQVRSAIGGIGQMIGAARKADNVDSLRGYEGKAGAYYFGAFKLLLQQDLGFQRREFYPAPDPVNALLGFGYGMLRKDVTAGVHLVGLDLFLGFFHAIEDRRPSLALDIMEEFRPIIVDPMVLDIVNRRLLTDEDFERTRNRKRPIQLSDAACELVVREYEKRINTQVYHPLAQQNTTYRRCFELQARRLARVILGKDERYVPMTIK
ncbi:MAG: CRISPR-associated endonuclease Cas1 [Anaerolineae bacterium]